MEIGKIILSLIGGLALFLYGMILISQGMQKAAGEKLKNALEAATSSTFRGIITGGFITSVIQSSSITTVTVIGLINAGLLTLKQSAGIILGADIGTTITAQIVAIPIGNYAMLIIGIGFLLMFLSGNNKPLTNFGEALLGLGILFLGMNIMKESMKFMHSSPFVQDIFINFGKYPIMGILIGAVFTGIIQSSSATSGLVIAMGMENLINLNTAISLMLGANIGTCITALIASIGSSLSARRAALLHILFKVIWVLIFFPFLPFFTNLAGMTSYQIGRQIANAHTLFNLIGVVLIIPFIGVVLILVNRLLPGEEVKVERGIKFIDKRTLRSPSVALSLAEKETVRMAEIALSMIADCERVYMEKKLALLPVIVKKEQTVDEINRKLGEYFMILSEKAMSKEETKKLASLLHSTTDIERVGDHINNAVEIAEKMNREKLSFSAYAMNELGTMFERVKDVFADAAKCLRDGDSSITKQIFDKEAEIDKLQKQFEDNHLKRLDQGICAPRAGVCFIDLLRNLERIGDHSDNIAHSILTGF